MFTTSLMLKQRTAGPKRMLETVQKEVKRTTGYLFSDLFSDLSSELPEERFMNKREIMAAVPL